jgi:hypothetical protein
MVLRPLRPFSLTVQAYLTHLHDAGFTGAPRPDQTLRLTPDGRWHTTAPADESAEFPQAGIVSHPR